MALLRIRILMWIRSRILALLCHFDADPDPVCYFDVNPDPSFHFDADPDPTFHFYADPDTDPTSHFYADPNPDPSFKIKAQNLEKKSVLIGSYGIPYMLNCHLRIDADPDPDPAYHIDADPNHTFHFDADPCGSESANWVTVSAQ
jgi:hypothetical protein